MRSDPNSGIGTPDKASVEVPKKKDDKYVDLSEEDLELKQHLEWFMEMIHHEDQGLQKLALVDYFDLVIQYMNPTNYERTCMYLTSAARTALAGIITVLHSCLGNLVFLEYHFIFYLLALAVQPRMLMTVDENLKPLPVPVRVSKAADVVGRGGQPKTITRFQSHLTPVILAAGNRAVLDTEKYIPLSPILEGFVILQENSDYCEDN